MLGRENEKQKGVVALSNTVQKNYHAGVKQGFILYAEFYAVSEARFLDILCQSFTEPNLKFSLNFSKYCHSSKYSRFGCDKILVVYCTAVC